MRIFGDPKTRVIGLNRRSKKGMRLLRLHAGGLVRSRFAGCAICGDRVRDLLCGDTRIFLELEVRLLDCRNCGKVKTRAAPLSGRQSALHQALCLLRRPALWICDDQGRCGDLRLDWHTVKTLDQQYMQAQLARAGRPGPQVIGGDEAIRKGHTYRIVVSDLLRGRPVWFGSRTARRRG